jgi:hypothetical protein
MMLPGPLHPWCDKLRAILMSLLYEAARNAIVQRAGTLGAHTLAAQR